LYTFGENGHGQLGIGTRNDTLAPTRVETFANLGLKVVDVALGYDHALAITGTNLSFN
jgi:alpha-tubulin suppressor-like RCC1 family protein